MTLSYLCLGERSDLGCDVYILNKDTMHWEVFAKQPPALPDVIPANSALEIYCEHLGINTTWNDPINFRIILAWNSNATAYHFDGSSWTTLTPSWVANAILSAIYATSYNDVYVRSSSKVHHWDGLSWTQLGGTIATSPQQVHSNGIWASDINNIYTVGGSGGNEHLYHYNGVAWTDIFTTDILAQTGLTAAAVGTPTCVWGFRADAIYVGTNRAAADGRLLKFNGSTWSSVATYTKPIITMWGASEFDLWIIASESFVNDILRYTGTLSFYKALPTSSGNTLPGNLKGNSSTDIMHGAYNSVGNSTKTNFYNVTPWNWDLLTGGTFDNIFIYSLAPFNTENPRFPAPFKGYRKLEEKPCIDNLPLTPADPMIKYGDCGEAVKKIQNFLENLLKDGYYDDFK